MFFNNKDIVWTVSAIASCELAIALNSDFARKAMECERDQATFANTVWLKTGIERKPPSQFIHFKRGILPQVFHCNTGEGVWLSLSEFTSSDPMRALTYFTHNSDRALDKLWFLNAFRAWAEAAKYTME